MQLHLIAATNDDGENLDLLVWANDKTEALIYWRCYYDSLTDGVDARVFHITAVDRPDGRRPGALPWGKEVVEL